MQKVNRSSLPDSSSDSISFTTIIFDFDGTLIDSKPTVTRCIRNTMQDIGQPLSTNTDLNWCVGPPLRHSFSKLLNTEDKELVEQVVSHYRTLYRNGTMFECELYPDIHEVLDALKQSGYRLFLATAKAIDFTQLLVDHFKLRDYFAGIYGVHPNGTPDTKEKLVAELARAENLLPHQTAMIGDREYDILGAKANQIYPIGVTYGYGSSEELLNAGALHLFESPLAIRNFFKRKGKGIDLLQN